MCWEIVMKHKEWKWTHADACGIPVWTVNDEDAPLIWENWYLSVRWFWNHLSSVPLMTYMDNVCNKILWFTESNHRETGHNMHSFRFHCITIVINKSTRASDCRVVVTDSKLLSSDQFTFIKLRIIWDGTSRSIMMPIHPIMAIGRRLDLVVFTPLLSYTGITWTSSLSSWKYTTTQLLI